MAVSMPTILPRRPSSIHISSFHTFVFFFLALLSSFRLFSVACCALPFSCVPYRSVSPAGSPRTQTVFCWLFICYTLLVADSWCSAALFVRVRLLSIWAEYLHYIYIICCMCTVCGYAAWYAPTKSCVGICSICICLLGKPGFGLAKNLFSYLLWYSKNKLNIINFYHAEAGFVRLSKRQS